MQHREARKATFVEVFESIKFSNKPISANRQQCPTTGFAVSRATHMRQMTPEELKLVRSSN